MYTRPEGGETISFQVQIDWAQVIRELEKQLCPKCRAKLRDVEVPLQQKIKLRDLLDRVNPPSQ